MSFNKSKLALAVAATAGLTFSAGAFATNGIMQAGNGMAAHGLGGAGLSNANEAMSGFDNPALISQTGDSVSMGFSVFMPDRQVNMDGALPGAQPEVVSDNKMFAIPQVAFTSKINDGMTWGIMVNAMGGMNTDYRTDPVGAAVGPFSSPTPAPGQMLAGPQTVDLSGMIIAPTMSFALGKDATVGASLLIGYTNFRVRNLFGSGLNNEGSAVGYGVKLGADFKVADGISVGAVLQPKIAVDEFDWFKNFLTAGFVFNGDAALTLPNIAGVGAKFAVGNNMKIVTDLMYYQWTSLDVFEFFGWDDQYVLKAGLEYQATAKLALRAGFNYGESPIQGGNQTGNGSDAAFANYPFPAISEQHITVGLGYKMIAVLDPDALSRTVEALTTAEARRNQIDPEALAEGILAAERLSPTLAADARPARAGEAIIAAIENGRERTGPPVLVPPVAATAVQSRTAARGAPSR